MKLYKDKYLAAKEIAPIFVQMRWKWVPMGIPTEQDILNELTTLSQLIENTYCIWAGRLAVLKTIDTHELFYTLEWRSWEEYFDFLEFQRRDHSEEHF